MTITKKIQLKRATLAQWTDFNPILDAGEVGVDLTNHKLKVGDGVTSFNSLPYVEGEIDLSNYYTKAQVDALIAEIDLTNYYTKTETDTLLSGKVNVSDLSDYYTKSQTYSQAETDSLLAGKVDDTDLATVATTGDYDDLSNKPVIPDISNLATKTELANGLAGKEDKITPVSPIVLAGITNEAINGYTYSSENTLITSDGYVRCTNNTSSYMTTGSTLSYILFPIDLSKKQLIVTPSANYTDDNSDMLFGYFNSSGQFIPVLHVTEWYNNTVWYFGNNTPVTSSMSNVAVATSWQGFTRQTSSTPLDKEQWQIHLDENETLHIACNFTRASTGYGGYNTVSLHSDAKLSEIRKINYAMHIPQTQNKTFGVSDFGLYELDEMITSFSTLYDTTGLTNHFGASTSSNFLSLNIGSGLSVDVNGNLINDNPTPTTVDQTYDATSTNAQSGTAVAGAISTLATKAELANGLDEKQDILAVDAPIALNTIKHSANLNVTNGNVSQISQPAGDKGKFVQSTATSRTNYLSSSSDYYTPSIENLTDFFAGGYVDIPLPATGSYSFMTGCRTRYSNFVLGKGYDNDFIPIAAFSNTYDNNGGLYLNTSDTYSLSNRSYGKYLQLSSNPVIAQDSYALDGGGGVSGLDLAVSIDKSNSSQYRIDYNFTTDGSAWYSKHSFVSTASYISRLDEITTLRLFINDTPAPSFTADRIGVYNYAGTFYAKSLEDLGTNLIDIEKLINGSEHLQLNIGNGLAVQNGNLVNTNPTPAVVDQTYDATSTNAQSGTAVAGAIADKVNGDGITNIVALTQNEYNALVTKDPNTLYTITDASVINDELYYKAGDTFTTSANLYCTGVLTAGAEGIRFTIPLPKRTSKVSSATIQKLVVAIRRPEGGYFYSSVDLVQNSNVSNLRCTFPTPNQLSVYFEDSTISSSNNIVLSVQLANNGTQITFS